MSTINPNSQNASTVGQNALVDSAGGSVGATVIAPCAKKFAKPFFSTAVLHVILTFVSLLMVLPFVWMLLTSLKPAGEASEENWIPSRVETMPLVESLPSVKVPTNYVDVFDEDNPDVNRRGINFERYYWNSILIATWVSFLQVLTSSMAAFSFSRIQWKGRDKVFLMYLATMMLPGLVMMIPNYQIMISLSLVDSFTGLILPAAFGAFGTFLLRQFMMTIPSSLDEAAEIDGASKWRLFWDIILPLSRPGLITLTIFTFIGNYNSYFWPLVMIKSEAKYTLPLGLMFFDSSRGQSTNMLMAAVTMSVIPMILLFVFLQKYLVKGIQLGAVKG
ncbi:MAG: carbohydrate ABC transporter permease [Phycisphaerales bacterium]|nr:carbohydrate ABC transporter permease [Phycisphaerales bacterium]